MGDGILEEGVVPWDELEGQHGWWGLREKKQSHELCLGVLRKINGRISHRRGNS